MSSVKSNFLWNTSYQVIRILTPIVTTPYLARVLGSEALGTYSYTYTVATYFTYFCLMGLGQYGNREISKCRNDRDKLSRCFSSILVMQVSIGALVVVGYFGYTAVFGGQYQQLLIIWSIWVIAEAVDISWLYYGLEEFRTITIRNIIVRTGVIVGIFAMVKSVEDLPLYCALQSLAFGANSVVLWAMAVKRVRFSKPTVSEITRHIKPNLTLFIPVIAISVYTRLNTILLSFFGNMSAIAFYDNSYKIISISLTVIQSLGTVMLPRMSSVLASGNGQVASRYLSNSIWIAQGIAVGLMFGIIGISQEFVPIFFGPGFEECSVLMSVLALMIPICAWSNFLGVQYLIPYGEDRQYLLSVLAGAIANLILCLALLSRFGAFGAVVATVAAELCVTITQILFVKSRLPIGRYLKEAAPFLLAGITELLVIRMMGNTFGATVLGLIYQVASGILAYVCINAFILVAIKSDKIRLLFKQNGDKSH